MVQFSNNKMDLKFQLRIIYIFIFITYMETGNVHESIDFLNLFSLIIKKKEILTLNFTWMISIF